MRSALIAVLLAVLAVPALACSGDEETVTVVTTVAATEAEETTTAVDEDASETLSEDESVTETTEEATPLATAEGALPELRLAVTSLERTSPDTVTLEFAITNERAEDFQWSANFSEEGATKDYGSVGGVYLADEVNQKKYFVLRDELGECICTNGLSGAGDSAFLDPGETAHLFAKFPAPPPDVDEITVVVPNFQPIEGVPISE